MSVFRSMTLITAIICGVGLSTSAGVTAQAASGADTAKPLSNSEIYRIYSQNSWMWKDGAGYFAVSKRQFTAWSGKGRNASVGQGIWFITDLGKLCFRATWYEKGTSFPATTCFSHREKSRTVTGIFLDTHRREKVMRSLNSAGVIMRADNWTA